MFLESAASFMADFGSPVIFGGLTTTALFDQPDVDIASGRVQSTQYRIEYPASDLSGLTNGSVVLIGITPGYTFDATGLALLYVGSNPSPVSAQFKVLGTPNLLDDGLFMEARLQRIAAVHLLTEGGDFLDTESGNRLTK